MSPKPDDNRVARFLEAFDGAKERSRELHEAIKSAKLVAGELRSIHAEYEAMIAERIALLKKIADEGIERTIGTILTQRLDVFSDSLTKAMETTDAFAHREMQKIIKSAVRLRDSFDLNATAYLNRWKTAIEDIEKMREELHRFVSHVKTHVPKEPKP